MTNYNREYGSLDDQWAARGVRAYSSFTEHPLRWILGTIVAIVVLVGVIGLASNWWGAQRAKLTVGSRVTQSVYQTDNAVNSISYFHRQCNRILADQRQISIAQSAFQGDEQQFRETTDPIAQQQIGSSVTQDRVNLTGAQGQLANDVREYDAKSADETANPFKTSGLPSRININQSTGALSGSVDCH